MNPEVNEWRRELPTYVGATNARETDSEYLRRVGLKPMVLELVGDSSNKIVLDVGCGDGWVLKSLSTKQGYECDVSEPDDVNDRPGFRVGDVRNLPFGEQSFDVLVASLVLMWLPGLFSAYAEMWRVARPGARLVIALVHPFFYRTGHAVDDGFLITRPLGDRWLIDDLHIGGRVGPFTYHYRPYSEYLTTAIRAGWVLEDAREWSVNTEEYCASVNAKDQVIARSNLVPLYSFLVFTKAQGVMSRNYRRAGLPDDGTIVTASRSGTSAAIRPS